MKKSKRFPLGDVLSVVTQIGLPPSQNYPSLMDITEFVIGRRNEATIDIPAILSAAKGPILKQHPFLQKIVLPKLKNEKAWNRWYKSLTQKYGKYVTLKPGEYVDQEVIRDVAINQLCQSVNISRTSLNENIEKLRKNFSIRKTR